MKITYFDNYAAMSAQASDIFVAALKNKKDSLVCCATGGSPTGLYQSIAKMSSNESTLFSNVRILKLDEWGGIPMSDPNSCHAYLDAHVLRPLKISPERYIAFNSEVTNVEHECKRIQDTIDNTGPIDLCILGLGKNGHLGFNEPADFLQTECHVAKLASATVQHNMVTTMPKTPTFGMTVGLRSIMGSRKILMLITGTQKNETIKKLMDKHISTQLPASFLWLHPDVECLIDKTSL
jgi:galactosamine-6-phosphate isomerase